MSVPDFQHADPAASSYQRAFAAERLRKTRLINALRFQGITAFLALTLLFHFSVSGYGGTPVVCTPLDECHSSGWC